MIGKSCITYCILILTLSFQLISNYLHKKLYLLSILAFLFVASAFGQAGAWTWISGDSAANTAAVFGTKGSPSVNNHPPPLFDALNWKDRNGNFWIYGGTDTSGANTDLWKYIPDSN